MMDVKVYRAGRDGADCYMATSVEPFGATSVVLAGAWMPGWNGAKEEGAEDARTIILPAPAAAGDRIEVRQFGN